MAGGFGSRRMVRWWLALAMGAVALHVGLPAAGAQVLLLPVEREGHVADASAVADMAATTGTQLHSHDAAREALVATHGEDPPEVTESDLTRWVNSSRQAVRSLARADYEGARSALAQAEAVTDRALAELNREATRARQVLDTCLYLVRSLEETDQHARAVEQGYACRRLVPRGDPTVTQHPPEVRAILDEVDAALRQMPPARLRVVSEPTGCAVRLNGLEFGATPLFSEDLRPGEYRVQIECGEQRGRVHRVELTRAGAELRVDAATESVLRTQPLRIVTGTSGVDAALTGHVARLGRIAGAREVWLVEESGAGRRRVLTLHRIDVQTDRELAVVRTGTRSLPLALASLRQGRSHDWTTDREIETADAPQADATETGPVPARADEQELGVRALPPEPEPTPAPVVAAMPEPVERDASAVRAGSDHTAENWVGAIAIAIGAGAYGTSWGLWDYRTHYHGHRLAIAEPTDADYLTRQTAWLDAQLPVWGVASGGALLWALAVPLTFGPDHEVPWWSWVLGALGAVGSGVGVAVLASTTLCTSAVELDQPCIDAAEQQDLGFLVLAQSVPFLAFPITHLIRTASGASDVQATAQITRDTLVLRIGGTW